MPYVHGQELEYVVFAPRRTDIQAAGRPRQTAHQSERGRRRTITRCASVQRVRMPAKRAAVSRTLLEHNRSRFHDALFEIPVPTLLISSQPRR